MYTLKPTLFLFLMAFISNTLFAQNTVPWQATGNVGIGTTSPGNKLSVLTTSYNDGLNVGHDGSAVGGPVGFVNLHGPSLQNGSYNGITVAGDAGLVYGMSNGTSPQIGFVITPWAAANSGLRLDKLGNVGIATNDTKGYQLAVNGQAIFTRAVVKLTQNWPDYVFREDYRLPSLDSISSYIRTYRHLPEMPSAASIEKDGIDLGLHQTVLLKKVEELTLYIIQQDKTTQDQDKTIQQQNQDIQSLKERLDRLEKLLAQQTAKP